MWFAASSGCQRDGEIEINNPQGPASQFGAGASPQYYQVWRENGTLLLRSPALGKSDLPHVAIDAPIFVEVKLPQGHPGRVVIMCFLPASEDEEVPSETTPQISSAPQRASAQIPGKRVIVAVAQDRSELKRIMTVLFSALLGIAWFMAVGIVAVVSVVVRRGLSPLQRVADEAARIDPHALDFRFSLAGLPAELRPICLRLNDSLERLQNAFARERRFTADVAHELRTPIAELRTLADVALKWDGDRETSLGYFKDAQDIARQMERIVTTLLSLARCQSGTMTVVCEPVNLGDLIREVWDGHRQAAAERHLDVTFDLSGQSVVQTDRTMLHSIVSNLLANAAQYARIGGTVDCSAISNGSGLKFTVTNNVNCLSPDDLPHMLEAFWRKDAARSDGTHCGLGLTLVAAYTAALGGKINVSLPKQDSICAALDLPTPCSPSA